MTWALLAALLLSADAGAGATEPSPSSALPMSPAVGSTREPLSLEPSLELPTALDDDELSLGWTLVRTMAVLGIVVALVYLTLNVGLRKLLGIRPVGASSGLVSVLERVPLDQKRSLFVVKVGREVLVVGAAEGGLALLTKVEPGEAEALVKSATPSSIKLSPFLQKLLSRKDAPPPASPPSSP